jgi:nucleotide-binding universal stress UspA family protein
MLLTACSGKMVQLKKLRSINVRILLAIDDSKFSQAAVRTVVAQVRTKGTEVRVLHVVEPIVTYISAMAPQLVPSIAEVEEECKKQATRLVQRAAQKLRNAGFRTSEVVDAGDPKVSIIEHAAEWRADLVVVGSHGWKGLSRFLMGSISEAVARHAGCSVQIVRIRNAAKRAKIRRSRR